MEKKRVKTKGKRIYEITSRLFLNFFSCLFLLLLLHTFLSLNINDNNNNSNIYALNTNTYSHFCAPHSLSLSIFSLFNSFAFFFKFLVRSQILCLTYRIREHRKIYIKFDSFQLNINLNQID